MRLSLHFISVVVFALSLVFSSVHATPNRSNSPIPFVTLEEFQDTAASAAKNVNLFKEVWEKDPNARFYGGTSRDFLYWVRRQLSGATSRDEAVTKIKALKEMSVIDVREFIVGESDIDIIGKNTGVDPGRYGVKKIDYINPALLQPGSSSAENERLQGYVPVEKIRLGRTAFETPLGNGDREIFQGKLTVHFSSPEDFAKSEYAKQGLNHPILLALRFLRQLSSQYYYNHDSGYPDKRQLLQIDPDSVAAVRKIISDSLESNQLAEAIRVPKVKEWMNRAIHGAFRSYTNPTAAMMLFEHFGVDKLVHRFAGDIEPVNQYLFAARREPEHVYVDRCKEYESDSSKLFIPVSQLFPDGNFYHGTRNEDAFWRILRQGILPSENGSAGHGLYGVAVTDKEFSEKWGGSKDRLVSFRVRPGARIVDISQGEGLKLFQAFGKNETEFASHFGIDILLYPYKPQAFVVKNSTALDSPRGVYRTFAKFSDLLKIAGEAKTEQQLDHLLRTLDANNLTHDESYFILKEIGLLKDHPIFKTIEETWNSRGMNTALKVKATKVAIRTLILNEYLQRHARSDNEAERHRVEIQKQLNEFIVAADGLSPVPDTHVSQVAKEKALNLFRLFETKVNAMKLPETHTAETGVWRQDFRKVLAEFLEAIGREPKARRNHVLDTMASQLVGLSTRESYPILVEALHEESARLPTRRYSLLRGLWNYAKYWVADVGLGITVPIPASLTALYFSYTPNSEFKVFDAVTFGLMTTTLTTAVSIIATVVADSLIHSFDDGLIFTKLEKNNTVARQHFQNFQDKIPLARLLDGVLAAGKKRGFSCPTLMRAIAESTVK